MPIIDPANKYFPVCFKVLFNDNFSIINFHNLKIDSNLALINNKFNFL